ncbi:MAG TPA: hypothetical protein VFA37_07070 [Gaiellaceae bacterium]|nr:hypothetical protein [Gaiellaceae bacterium]
MRALHRSLLIVGLALAAAGCGGSAARTASDHGILFTYTTHPNLWCGRGCGGDIYLWTPGSQPRQLTNSPDPKVDPQWSPDGTRIAWTMPPAAICREDAETCGGKYGCVDEIYVADSAGGPPMQVSPAYSDSSGNTGCSTGPLGWSPDGKQLLITRSSATAPSNLAILTLATGAVEPLHVPDLGSGNAAWGKPGIAYVYARTVRTHRPPYGHTIYEFRVVAPSPGGLRFVIPIKSETGSYNLAWSSRGELATIQGKRLVVYSSSGRRVADFSAPQRREAPALGSTLVWSPDGDRLLVCIDPYGGLSAKAHRTLVNSRQKRDRYPAPVPYVVDRDGTHWQRLRLPNPGKKETLCSASSWR